MLPHPHLKTYHTGQVRALQKYGFPIWDIICAHGGFYRPFKASEAAAMISDSLDLVRKTAIYYTMAVLNNVLLDQDQNNPCLEKLGPRWRLREVEYK